MKSTIQLLMLVASAFTIALIWYGIDDLREIPIQVRGATCGIYSDTTKTLIITLTDTNSSVTLKTPHGWLQINR